MNPITKREHEVEQASAQREKRDINMSNLLGMERSAYNSYRVIFIIFFFYYFII
jgi:hypothetical protein